MRIGFGFDAHRLVPGGRLVLGGVEIPHSQGLAGHSDADVLTHAIIDALLGAAGLGDIGTRYPDSDDRYQGISSLRLLSDTRHELEAHGFNVTNIDATVVCETPRIAPHAAKIRQRLAAVLDLDQSALSVKGKTTEKMGFTGRGEGIACYCVALIDQVRDD